MNPTRLATIVFDGDRALHVSQVQRDADAPIFVTLVASGSEKKLPVQIQLDRKGASELAHALQDFVRRTTPRTPEKPSPDTAPPV